jgi:ElaB/YqjD/DUF883 family membrane-anchored ribosome-binding protein
LSEEVIETTPKQVAKNAKSRLEDAKERVLKASRTVREEAENASEYAKERYGTASESIREGYDKARRDMDGLREDVTVYVRDNPGRSVLIAGAIGFFIGFLIRSDRRR